MTDLHFRYRGLLDLLSMYPSQVVALSGGADSAFLLAAAKESGAENVSALTVATPYVPEIEMNRAGEISAFLDVPHRIVEIKRIHEKIEKNPADRCYSCKRILFSEILREAESIGAAVFDGSNADDKPDRRPGMKALRELGVKSPLAECGLTKKDVRTLSRQMGLPSADIPSCSCLLTRFPYNTRIEEGMLRRVESAEEFIRDRDFRQVRVRVHGDVARIEVGREERIRFFNGQFLDELHAGLSALGFRYVAVDAYGFASGRMDDDKGETEK